jgi:hypothetical protein
MPAPTTATRLPDILPDAVVVFVVVVKSAAFSRGIKAY